VGVGKFCSEEMDTVGVVFTIAQAEVGMGEAGFPCLNHAPFSHIQESSGVRVRIPKIMAKTINKITSIDFMITITYIVNHRQV
jgi:hypothetical protein